MFNKAVFKQTVKANRTLWLIVTGVLTLILVLIIFQFDPSQMQSLMNAMQGSGILGEAGGDGLLSGNITILGILSQSFYTMIAIIIILVFIIIASNNLIAGEVDRGSMAYTLSTPIKRTSVIFTKAMFLISSLFVMILIFTIAGIASVQIKYQLIWGTSYTGDIKEIAKESEFYNREELDFNFKLITDDLHNEGLVSIGSKKREVSDETYELYLFLRATNRGLEASASVLGIDSKDINKNLDKVLASQDSLLAGAKYFGNDVITYRLVVTTLKIQNDSNTGNGGNQEEFMEKFELIYKELGMTSMGQAIAQLESIITKEDVIRKHVGPVEADVQAFIFNLRVMSANNLIGADNSITFDTWSFVKINIGLFLLMFAISGISFISSSIFNLSKNSFALGAGLPLAFWILQIVANIDESLEKAKYLSLNTLFNPSSLMKGGSSFLINFGVLLVVGTGLYVGSIYIFKHKDLPL